MNDFYSLDVSEPIIVALAKNSITIPTPVQIEVIPRILAGENIAFQSETGTGKTLCYLIPAFLRSKPGKITTLVLAPTHELGSQIRQNAANLAKEAELPITASLCIGGAPLKRQIELLKKKPDILVGGPARILELIRLKKFSTQNIEMVVLDETDRMLSPEMRDIITELLGLFPTTTQYVACSATLGPRHVGILENGIPAKPTITRVELPEEDVLTRNITHWAFFCERRDKIDTLRRFLVAEKPAKTLVFTAIIGQVENISDQLTHRGIVCASLHSRLDKMGRKKAIDQFRSGKVPVLITSDLAARGLDIPGVTHIVQLDVQENTDFFVHRAGRTARAGRTGINAVFGDEHELRGLSRMEKKLKIIIHPKVLYGSHVVTPEQPRMDEIEN